MAQQLFDWLRNAQSPTRLASPSPDDTPIADRGSSVPQYPPSIGPDPDPAFGNGINPETGQPIDWNVQPIPNYQEPGGAGDQAQTAYPFERSYEGMSSGYDDFDSNELIPVYVWRGVEYLGGLPPEAPQDLKPVRFITRPTGNVS